MEHMSSPVRFPCNEKDMSNMSLFGTFSPYIRPEKESSSLSIKDQDDTDLPPTAGEDVPAQQTETGTTERLPDQPELHPHSLPAGLATPPRPPRKPTRVRTETHFQPLQRRLASQGSLDTLRPHSPWMQPDPYSGPEDQDKEYVGFATLPNQVNRKNAKKGFTFTLMVAGESGLGKSTMINSLFLTDLYTDRRVPNAEERIIQTVNVIKYTVGIEEKGVRLHLNIIDTPGFGDAVNNTETWAEVEDYIDQQFEQYFRQESGLNRRNIQDNRVHCCLYFISPFGHGLRPLDVECMRALHGKVNIVPVLAKADSLTPAEVCRKKLKIKEEILKFGINIYQFPDCDSDEEEELKQQDQMLKDSIPFAVIGSNIQVESKGRRFRGRLYPWGVAEVENPEHSDFLLLRNTLIRTHMQDLKDVTQESHYENYRAQCIQSMTRLVVQERRRSLCDKLQQENRAGTPVRLAVIYGEKEKLVLEEIDELHSQRAPLHAKSLTHSPTPVSPSTSPSSPSSSSSSLAEENVLEEVLEEVPERIQEETQRNQRGDERNKRERRRGDRGRVL